MTRCCADCQPAPFDNQPRVYALTGKALGLMASSERLTPADLFTPEQYDAIRNAGLDVFFVPAESLLGVTS